jgi:hypothetical protein
METLDERPEMRTGFKYADLRGHVRAHRGRLLSAAFTILRGWFVAGRPSHKLAPWGSFEGWSNIVREVLVWAGLPDPGETRLSLQTASDSDANNMTTMIDALVRMDPDRRGVTTSHIIDIICNPPEPTPDWHSDLKSAVEELCGKPDSRSLGIQFRKFKRRNFNGRMIDHAGEDRLKGKRWAIYPAASPALRSELSPETFAGDAGDVPARNRLLAGPATERHLADLYESENLSLDDLERDLGQIGAVDVIETDGTSVWRLPREGES